MCFHLVRMAVRIMPVCKRCGYNNKEENNYCANCGARLGSEQGSEKQRTEVTQKTKTLVGMIAFVVIFSVISIAIWWSIIQTTPGVSQATFTFVVESNTQWSSAFKN